jgi:hypothetical protein
MTDYLVENLRGMCAFPEPYGRCPECRELRDFCTACYAAAEIERLRAARADADAPQPAKTPDFTMSCSVCGEPVILDVDDADVRHKRCRAEPRMRPAQDAEAPQTATVIATQLRRLPRYWLRAGNVAQSDFQVIALCDIERMLDECAPPVPDAHPADLK